MTAIDFIEHTDHKALFAGAVIPGEIMEKIRVIEKETRYDSDMLERLLADYPGANERNLGAIAYYGRNIIDRERENAQFALWEAEGFQRLTPELHATMIGKRVILRRKVESYFGTNISDLKCRVVELGFLPPRCTRRGIHINGACLDKSYVKLAL